MIVCGFTYGDGHVCDQRLGIRHSSVGPYPALLQAPRGWYYPPAVDGIYELRRMRKPRRPTPETLQPKDDYDQPMWPSRVWWMPGLNAKHIIGEHPELPARIRCRQCKQVRSL
jgi:hypothetical protein